MVSMYTWSKCHDFNINHRLVHKQNLSIITTIITAFMLGEFGIVYKGSLIKQYTDEVVAIKTLKGEVT